MQTGSNCALPNLALLDKRVQCDKLNVNKQREQTKNSLCCYFVFFLSLTYKLKIIQISHFT